MPRNFGLRSHHHGLPRAFDLTPVSFGLDFVLMPVLITGLLGFVGYQGTGWRGPAAALIAGVIVWSLAEYWIHRLLLHGAWSPFEPMHQMHHRLPKDMIGVASWGTGGIFFVIWLIGASVAPQAIAAAFTAGLMGGYLAYCIIHLRFHHHAEGARLSRYVAWMKTHHNGHHRGGRGNFGVTSPVWDIVFRTWRRRSV